MKRFILFTPAFLMLLLAGLRSFSQTHVFAQLNGTPINTTGWSMAGLARAGNVIQSGNSELIVCPVSSFGSGAIFYNQPINLSLCSKWIAEFDFRIYDGSLADGLAFCFLDVPPTGFVTGGGLGIPGSANGLKICFDPNPNCAPYGMTNMPKIEMRWGTGYDECWAQPTADNNTGTLNFVRSATYNHAKITYDNGTIKVYVNNSLYVTGTQQFNFTGYLGFTASTGGKTDNHSIKNVIIYTDMPPSEAGANASICNNTVQIGTTSNAAYLYTWSPATGLSATNVADPVATLSNTTTAAISRKYYVKTAFAANPGCASTDSITVTVNPQPAISITASQTNICAGTTVQFTATVVNGGSSPSYQWICNGNNVGNNSATYSNSALTDNDIVSCVVKGNGSCTNSVTSNDITIKVSAVASTISIATPANSICNGTSVTFTATIANGGSLPQYQWKLNGNNTGANSATYTSNSLANGNIVSCTMTSSLACTEPVSSNNITMTVTPAATPTLSITVPAITVCEGTPVVFSAVATDGGNAPVYQWKKNGTNVGANAAAYTDAALANNDLISCVITSTAACVTTATAVSNVITMQVNPTVTASVSITASRSAICSGEAITFTATPANGGATPLYQWMVNATRTGNTSNVFNSTTLQNNDVISCILTSSETCIPTTQSNNITIKVTPAPVVHAGSDKEINDGKAVLLDATVTGNITALLWSPTTGLNSSTLLRPLTNPVVTTTYSLLATNADGCTATDAVTVTVLKRVTVPNAFTPNGDGNNDTWQITYLKDYAACRIEVFNRYGHPVFLSTGYNKPWDGTLNNTRLPAATYYYIIDLKNGAPVLSGSVTILR